MTVAAIQQQRNNNTLQPGPGLPQSNVNDVPRTVRHSKSQHGPSGPTTSHFYPAAWQTVIERAKHRFVRHVFKNQGFPVRDKDLNIAEDILYEEIARGEAEKLTLDDGNIMKSGELMNADRCSLAYHQTRQMNIVVMQIWF